jgi:hypothetical protein
MILVFMGEATHTEPAKQAGAIALIFSPSALWQTISRNTILPGCQSSHRSAADIGSEPATRATLATQLDTQIICQDSRTLQTYYLTHHLERHRLVPCHGLSRLSFEMSSLQDHPRKENQLPLTVG